MRVHAPLKGLEALYEVFLGDPATPLARLNLVVKFALLTLALIAAPFSGSPLGLLALTIIALVVLVASRRPEAVVDCAWGLRYLLILIATTTAVVEYLRGYSVTALLIDSLTMCLRVVLLLTIFSVVSSALTLEEVIRVAGLLRVPKCVAYSFILALRFIPLVLHDVNEVSASLKLKGLALSEGGLRWRVRALTCLLTALVIIVSFRRFKVAEAIEVRGLLEERRE